MASHQIICEIFQFGPPIDQPSNTAIFREILLEWLKTTGVGNGKIVVMAKRNQHYLLPGN